PFGYEHRSVIQFHVSHHCAIRRGDDYVWIGGHCAFRITEKRDSAQTKQQKKPECPCREQSENDREQRKNSQNPPCFPESLEAHKKSLFSEPENGWSRRQNEVRQHFSQNHNIMGSTRPSHSISSGNNLLQGTRLFVVPKPFSAILFVRGVWPHFYGASSRGNSGRKS